MRHYAIVAALAALSLVAESCADAPTRPERDVIAPEQGPAMSRAPSGPNAGLLTNRRIEEPLEGGGTFIGTLTIKRLDWDQAENRLEATVEVSGRAMKDDGGIMKTADGRPAVIPTGKPVTVAGVPVTLARGDDVAAVDGVFHPAQAVCDILLLDLAPIHLDLLGLVLNTSQIVIDLDAVSGAGNLLGNLLCALLGLLDPLAALQLITQLLEAINALLQNLSTGGGALVA